MAVKTAKKTVAKKAPAKKAPAKKAAAKAAATKSTAPAPAKKSVAKKAAAKKATNPRRTLDAYSKEKSMGKSLKVGDSVEVQVDPRQNNGSDVAVGLVTKASDETVNVKVFLDSEESLYLRDVAVVKSAPKEGDEKETTGRICWSA